ncbi:MAG: preprotein translocase subunit YajC [Candidatus Rokuibacteriota bacterium]|nr:MAG: preprotein translocase subunit YajC [Candidatus Rokubacteria bacterium]
MGPPSGAGPGSVVTQILFFGAIFGIFYFLLIRPQQKQRKDRERMLDALKKGDRVVTSSGLHGTIVGMNEQTIVLKVTDQGVKLEFDRSAVGRVAEGQRDRDA